jgi:hypothetical protein
MELHNLASPGRLQMNNLFGATDFGATRNASVEFPEYASDVISHLISVT